MVTMTDTKTILGGTLRLPKSALEDWELDQIRREMTYNPSSTSKYGFGGRPVATITYNEDADWLDVPRAYGLSAMRRFSGLKGMNVLDRTSPGEKVEFSFDEARQASRPSRKAIQDRMVNDVVTKFKRGTIGGVLHAPCGCHAAGELVLMADGTTKKAEDVVVGDLLMGVDSPRRVLELHRGRQQMVRVTPNKGDPFTVNLGHILTVMWSVSDGARRDGELIDIPVSEWILSSQNFKRHTVLYRPGVDSFDRPKVDVYRIIRPYWLGLLLGDGTLKRSPAITTKDAEIVGEVVAMAGWLGLRVREDAHEGRCPTYHLTCEKRGGGAKHDQNALVLRLKELGLWGTDARTKFIPDQYKYGSADVRKQVLAGLIDTDGALTCGCFEFSSVSEQLADDVVFLSKSLGLAAYKKPKRVKDDVYWRVMISGECSTIPTRLPRKKCGERRINKDARRVGIKSTKILPEDDYYGFVVDGDHRYLMADFTLTHNTGKTVMGLKVAAEMGLTTLVLVYKDFLVDQWRDRITQWLGIPAEEIGVIQQDRCEFEGRKIVIAMIQSVVERDYDPALWSWAGLVIADEVHRHGADLWNKASIRFNAKYRLGLTATPDRKDGMWSIVINNFGPIIASDSGEAMKPTIYTVFYKPKINVGQYCWIGASPMGVPRIKKVYLGKFLTLLARDQERNQLIVNIMLKAARENRKVLLLTDRREHITILKTMILEQSNNEVTVGRYIGGMSESARSLSEQCQIILGTFQMAQEALDIPALDVGILATPHADVEQPVGRICRQMEGKKEPVIVDIVDIEQQIGMPFFRKRSILYARKEWTVRKV